MKRTARITINNIIAIDPYIYELQDRIDKEQERLIRDLTSPAIKVVEKLVALDNRRIDLCNLKVLYAFVKRELGNDFPVLENVAMSGGDSVLYDRAERAIEAAGYTLERVSEEFSYLFKKLPTRAANRTAPPRPPRSVYA